MLNKFKVYRGVIRAKLALQAMRLEKGIIKRKGLILKQGERKAYRV